MKEEHGLDVFFGGCPVCKELCCCNNKSVFCHRKNHCYRKCPATKTNGKNVACGATTGPVKDDSDSEPYAEDQLSSIPKPENGQYGIFDLLAAVADMDKANPTLGKGGSKNGNNPSATGASAPRKKAKTTKEGGVGASGMSKNGFPSNMLLCEPSYTPYYAASGSAEGGSNLQLLHNSKHSPNLTGTAQTLPAGLSGDSGVDGFTFNNNTMGIIRGNINGVDAITLMGQQKHKFASSMDQLGALTMPGDNLLSGITTSSAASATAGTLTSASAAQGTSVNIYNRLPSIDSNPFSTTATKDASRQTATFDQALLDSVRNIQADPYLARGQPLPVPPQALKTEPSAGVAEATTAHNTTTAATSYPAESIKNLSSSASNGNSSSSSARGGMSHAAAAALEPMNLLALVSSFTQSLGKELPSERLLLGGAVRPATDSTTDTKPTA